MILSVAEQRVIRLCRIIGYGHIDALYVSDAEPSHLVGERAIECRIDPTKGDSRCVEPFELQEPEADVALHPNEERLVHLIRSVQRGFIRIAVKDGIPVSWNYYPDLPSRAELRSKAVDELMLDPK